ncbi:hypothetical protein [Halostagnicola kamekurae]|uniref:Uncharacterized protein n=1 Tax=Halostagnicola kamekurae TaxID=619731 RepID=A0A1I6UBN3_9EURY|nr:hypothetical protein [Halostagnicola kamekurae]SFS98798.1 hypothetical protein SAMN04488556_3717 [Halostagnicola kamekurae]
MATVSPIPRPAYCVGYGGAPYEAMIRVLLCVDGTSLAPHAVFYIEQ